MCIIPEQIHVELLCLNESPFVFRSLLLLYEADGFLKQNVSVFCGDTFMKFMLQRCQPINHIEQLTN